MKANHVIYILLGLVLIAAGADIAWYYPQLPDQIATHFNGRGQPDGSSGKVGFVVGQGFLLVFMPAFFVGISCLIGRLPTSLINVPNRDYWLSPARKAVTLAILHRMMLLFALVMTTFMAGLMHLILAANLGGQRPLGPGFGALVGGQLVSVVALLVWILTRFRRPSR